MAEARQLKAGRWRIYTGPELGTIRDPVTGSIVTFDSLEAARRWWRRLHPGDQPLEEAVKCARCGAYFGVTTPAMQYAGRHYHASHTPQVVDARRSG
jgi:hypothetical protein